MKFLGHRTKPMSIKFLLVVAQACQQRREQRLKSTNNILIWKAHHSSSFFGIHESSNELGIGTMRVGPIDTHTMIVDFSLRSHECQRFRSSATVENTTSSDTVVKQAATWKNRRCLFVLENMVKILKSDVCPVHPLSRTRRKA